MIERISDIKAQSVNAESFDPHFYAAKQMVCDRQDFAGLTSQVRSVLPSLHTRSRRYMRCCRQN